MKTEEFSDQSSVIKKSSPRLGIVQSLDIIYLQTPNSKFQHLFDYDEQYPKARKMVLKDSAVLAHTKDGKFCFLKDNFDKDQKSKNIMEKINLIYCSFNLTPNFYLLKPINHPLAQDLWLDISSLPSKVFIFEMKLFPIRKNDVIKMGSKLIKFRQVMSHDQNVPLQFQDQPIISNLQVIEQAQSINSLNNTVKLCNVCNQKGLLNNPLVIPCQCLDNKYIHFQCIKAQLMKKLKVKANQNSYTATWTIPKCEKCHSKFKTTYTINNNQYKALVIPRPDPPYVIFEHEAFNKNNVKKKYLEIIPVEPGNILSIGRSSESSICLQMDESLESGHCQLIYDPESKKFLLMDLGSQYGTLIQVKESIMIRPHHPNIRIQIENVAIDLNAKRTESIQKCVNYDSSHKVFEDQTNQKEQEDREFFV